MVLFTAFNLLQTWVGGENREPWTLLILLCVFSEILQVKHSSPVLKDEATIDEGKKNK